MYNLDWSKYLSADRFRPSSSTIGKDGDFRNAFESDLGRVIFCPAIRRMHDKTQVIPLTGGDTVLTRLTHSLQVMNVAESLAINYTRSEVFQNQYGDKASNYAQSISAILRTASLLHDIGNPPFGHFGELTIQHYFNKEDVFFPFIKSQIDPLIDFTQFDGNAMGLRMVSKLQYTGTLDGLNLTYGSLGAYLKYPNESSADKHGYVGCHKHGIFKTEIELFEKIVANCNMRKEDGSIKRHPLAFLVEAADSICYGAMDIEDGFTLGWYTFDLLVRELSEYAYKSMGDGAKNSTQVQDSMDEGGHFSIEKFLGFRRQWENGTKKESRRLILDFRVKLIDYLVRHATEVFIDNLEKIDEGTYNEELLKDDDFKIFDSLGTFTKNYIISQPQVQMEEIKGAAVITGLFDILIRYVFHSDEKYRAKVKGIISSARLECVMHENSFNVEKYFDCENHNLFDYDLDILDPYSKLRLVVDFVAGMTDKFSVEIYQKLSGINC